MMVVLQAKLENQYVSSSKECCKPQAVKSSATFCRTPSDYSHRIARKTTTKRKLTDLALSPDNPSKVSCLKQRKSSKNDGKITKMDISLANKQHMNIEISKIGLDG